MKLSLVDIESTAKRRLIIILTIIPLTFYIGATGAVTYIRNLWSGAAVQWKKR